MLKMPSPLTKFNILLTKALKKRGIEHYNLMKAIYDKPIANITLYGETLEPFLLKIVSEAKVSTLPTLIQHSTGIPSKSNKIQKRNAKDSTSERIRQIFPICR
jgi:hypothetical protein